EQRHARGSRGNLRPAPATGATQRRDGGGLQRARHGRLPCRRTRAGMVTALSQCATDGRRPEFPAQVAPILGRMALRLAMVALVLTAGCGAPLPGPAAPAAADVAGSWAGRVDRPGAPLELDVTFTGGPGSLAGTLDVPAQRIAARPLVDVAVDGATVR